MLVYTVTYPGRKDFDRNVPWSYLEKLAEDRKNGGAKAVCENGENRAYVLVDGRWEDAERRGHQ